jgi:putative hydrolase of the HAD superfamily
MAERRYVALFSDIGGVLGTNGWDTDLRIKISRHFGCDLDRIQSRHRLMFDSYERGYMTFEDYLKRVFCPGGQAFTIEQVRDYAYEQSIPWPENIQLLHRVKVANSLKLAFISNEGEGLTEYRVKRFGLRDVADFMIFSYFVHMRKPDLEMWRLALSLAQVAPEEAIYIDDRQMFADVAAELGFAAIRHTSLQDTRKQLSELGLSTH